jgi:hypothetical protein
VKPPGANPTSSVRIFVSGEYRRDLTQIHAPMVRPVHSPRWNGI